MDFRGLCSGSFYDILRYDQTTQIEPNWVKHSQKRRETKWSVGFVKTWKTELGVANVSKMMMALFLAFPWNCFKLPKTNMVHLKMDPIFR